MDHEFWMIWIKGSVNSSLKWWNAWIYKWMHYKRIDGLINGWMYSCANRFRSLLTKSRVNWSWLDERMVYGIDFWMGRWPLRPNRRMEMDSRSQNKKEISIDVHPSAISARTGASRIYMMYRRYSVFHFDVCFHPKEEKKGIEWKKGRNLGK